jgi:acetoin utilization protein AcuB
MRVKDRMTRDVVTASRQDGLNETTELMKQHNIRRVPIVENGAIVGIVTEMDINRAAPSSATALSKNELTYLLAKLKIQDILPKNQQVLTVEADCYIEIAARLMREHQISGLPVVQQGQLVGIITETDIFDALIDILGVKKKHTRLELYSEDRVGVLAEMTGTLARHNLNILNAVVFFEETTGKYKVILRVEGDMADLPDELKQKFQVESIVAVDSL